MGKKSFRSRRCGASWSAPFKPTPLPGEKYATIPVNGRALTIDEEHAAEEGALIEQSLNLTDRILVKWNIVMATQMQPADEPFMHRAICSTFNGDPPANTPASHPLAEKIGQFKTPPDVGGFVRHKDMNSSNNEATNLEFVTLEDAIAHYHEWVVDYALLLTDEESALVADAAWRSALLF